MKCSESWLRKWINTDLTGEQLCHILTMAGLEVEQYAPVANKFSGVVIGEIVKIEKHPTANHLHSCEVNIGKSSTIKIVCGATNISKGMKAPVAIIGAVLPNNKMIQTAILHGMSSEGMLCSAKELGLSEESEGIFALDTSAPVGDDLRNYLNLDDYIFDISITPNRGDCLSIKGLAREISALTRSAFNDISILPHPPTDQASFPISIQDPSGCPRYVGRVIRNVKADAVTPAWLRNYLQHSGIRAISPIVDITNYVMLELGQPMHAFDLSTIKQGIIVRQSKQDEQITLLDGSEQTLDAQTLIIADHEKPLAIAGVMGGLNSSVTLLTKDIFLESAYFFPEVIARQRQYYNLSSESAYRFERSIDPTIQQEAIERATQLILSIAGGEPGPVMDFVSQGYFPKKRLIELSSIKTEQVLGMAIPKQEINAIFNALKFSYEDTTTIKNISPEGIEKEETIWCVCVPSFRADITIREDLIEEIARLHGYDNIPTHQVKAELLSPQPVQTPNQDFIRQILSDGGYHEIISYSFIDKKLQSLLDPNELPRELLNPISTEMAVMRTNLWPGLINTLLYNKSRQQSRVRLFELGTCFISQGKEIVQPLRLAGLASGLAYPEQWGQSSRDVDFYDLKGDVENLLRLLSTPLDLEYRSGSHAALHPGQSAGIYNNGQKIGILGSLHPIVLQALGISNKVFVYELYVEELKKENWKRFHEISKYPEIRRDIAIIVNQAIPAKEIQDTIKMSAGNWLKDVFIFDVYIGKGISPGLKSIALALIFQHPTRTLVDDEVTEVMGRVTETLKGQLGAALRS